MPGLQAEVVKRVVRALALWRARRHEMRVDAGGYWLVPSKSASGCFQRVSPDGDICGCGDARYGIHKCKHGWCVTFEAALRTALARAAGADDPQDAGRGFGRRPR